MPPLAMGTSTSYRPTRGGTGREDGVGASAIALNVSGNRPLPCKSQGAATAARAPAERHALTSSLAGWNSWPTPGKTFMSAT
jgi:hypothetical protein